MKREDYYWALKDSLLVQHTVTTEPRIAPFHFHDAYEIFLFLSGDVDFYAEQSHHRLQRGHLLVLNDRELHRACHYGAVPYERIAVHFNHRLVQALSTSSTNLLACFQNRRFGTHHAILISEEQIASIINMSRRLQEISKSSQYGNDVLMIVYLSELLVLVNTLFRDLDKDPPFAANGIISEIIDYIDAHLTSELSLGRLAARFAIDPSHLSHLFKRQTGNTLYQYILIKRVAMAKQYLTEGKTVTETCALSGFNDYNNFIRTFKKIAGVSPGKYHSRT